MQLDPDQLRLFVLHWIFISGQRRLWLSFTGERLCIMCCKLSSTAAQGISSQTLTWGHKDLMRGRGRSSEKAQAEQRTHHEYTHMYSHTRCRTKQTLSVWNFTMAAEAFQTWVFEGRLRAKRWSIVWAKYDEITHLSHLVNALCSPTKRCV